MGRLFFESHESMEKDYEVSLPKINFIVEQARMEPSIYGARTTGPGESVVMIGDLQKSYEAAERIVRACRAESRLHPVVLVPVVQSV